MLPWCTGGGGVQQGVQGRAVPGPGSTPRVHLIQPRDVDKRALFQARDVDKRALFQARGSSQDTVIQARGSSQDTVIQARDFEQKDRYSGSRL